MNRFPAAASPPSTAILYAEDQGRSDHTPLPHKDISVIIPARNEASALGDTVSAILESAADLQDLTVPGSPHLSPSPVEVLVVDNASTDETVEMVRPYTEAHGVNCILCHRLGAACARNLGAHHARGRILVFVDADTRIPRAGLRRIMDLVDVHDFKAGIFPLTGDSNRWPSVCWWAFWNLVRRLPLPRAKALPAFMFCTRELFDELGPFDERVQIGEEWPILAGCYRRYPRSLIYDRSLCAMTSNRRMTSQSYGYARTFLKYVWAVLHHSGRRGYPDTFRERAGAVAPQCADDLAGTGARGTHRPPPAGRGNPGPRLGHGPQRRLPTPSQTRAHLGG